MFLTHFFFFLILLVLPSLLVLFASNGFHRPAPSSPSVVLLDHGGNVLAVDPEMLLQVPRLAEAPSTEVADVGALT